MSKPKTSKRVESKQLQLLAHQEKSSASSETGNHINFIQPNCHQVSNQVE